ncbi:MAG: hypothetical protein GY866_03515, partial [Proteobacteria bacterium]|nr:hypothetical protein [Pseudomonadota bacterium]
MDELKDLLKTRSRMTVFRKLKKLDYISSCSHKGKYYSLNALAEYDEHGVWLYESVSFSKHGTVGKTLEHLIDNSPKGCSAYELYSILEIKVDDALLALVKNGGATRKKTSGCYVYYSKAPNLARKQELTRKDGLRSLDTERVDPGISTDELKAALIIFFSTLNEKQRRFYAGFESLKVGRGGDELIAELLDLNPKTVARGRRELLGGKTDVDTIREKGGGRKRIKKKS